MLTGGASCDDPLQRTAGQTPCPAGDILYTIGTINYIYDAEGRRVEKTSSTFSTTYIYDAAGKVVVESTVPVAGTSFPVQAPVTGTEYLMGDHLGSTRLSINNQGQVLRRYDFLPFGEEIVAGVGGRGADYEPSSYVYPTTPDDVLKKFTGKERDAETGLDYFGARYLSSAEGRFVSPDPAGIMRQKLRDPQQWNMYSYVRNNPLRLVDENGQWPTEIHNKIIQTAFPGLSAKQISTLKSASYWMDHGATSQMKSSNHEHFMKSPGEDPHAAAQASKDFIHKEESAAQKDQGGTPQSAGDINDKSLGDFGKALHTVTDGTSPAHVDANGNPRDWNGIPTSQSEIQGVQRHEAEEANPTPTQLNNAVSAAQQAFKDTYGDAAYQQAIKKKDQQ